MLLDKDSPQRETIIYNDPFVYPLIRDMKRMNKSSVKMQFYFTNAF